MHVDLQWCFAFARLIFSQALRSLLVTVGVGGEAIDGTGVGLQHERGVLTAETAIRIYVGPGRKRGTRVYRPIRASRQVVDETGIPFQD